MSLTQAPRGEDAEAGGAEMRDGSSSSPDRAMSMGFAAPQCHCQPSRQPQAGGGSSLWPALGAGRGRECQRRAGHGSTWHSGKVCELESRAAERQPAFRIQDPGSVQADGARGSCAEL